MDKNTFMLEQFRTLRTEIKETKARIFRTLIYGLIVVPAAHFLADTYKLEIVLYSTPILVIVIGLLYLSENHALMRCGRYILQEIEPSIPEVTGWERWLEKKGPYDPRTVDKFLTICSYLLFFIYFSGSVYMAVLKVYERFGQIAAGGAIGVYIAIGIWFLIFLIKNSRTSTRTVFDEDK